MYERIRTTTRAGAHSIPSTESCAKKRRRVNNVPADLESGQKKNELSYLESSHVTSVLPSAIGNSWSQLGPIARPHSVRNTGGRAEINLPRRGALHNNSCRDIIAAI